MPASYPGSVAVFPIFVDLQSLVTASIPNNLGAEIIAIETLLGVQPTVLGSSLHTSGTVAANIDTIYNGLQVLQNEVGSLTAGSVISVGAGDASLVKSGTSTQPLFVTGSLDTVARLHPPVSGWSNNGQKITNVFPGLAATDAANVSQLPTWIAPRVLVVTPIGTQFTPSTLMDEGIISPTANFTVLNPTGVPADGQKLILRIVNGGTGFTPSFGAGYISSGIAALPATAFPANKTCTLGFKYDTSRTAWVLLALDAGGY